MDRVITNSGGTWGFLFRNIKLIRIVMDSCEDKKISLLTARKLEQEKAHLGDLPGDCRGKEQDFLKSCFGILKIYICNHVID